MLVLKALGTTLALSTAGGAGTRHVFSHPGELQVAQVVELVQLNCGLQLQVPGSQMGLQGVEPGWREERGETGAR